MIRKTHMRKQIVLVHKNHMKMRTVLQVRKIRTTTNLLRMKSHRIRTKTEILEKQIRSWRRKRKLLDRILRMQVLGQQQRLAEVLGQRQV